MAYIERVKVFTILNDLVNDCTDKDEFYNRAFDAVDTMTAAEVAPASEVARLEKLLDDKCDRCIAREKANTAKEIFSALNEMAIPEKCTDGCAFYLDMEELSELEKKYTEGA